MIASRIESERKAAPTRSRFSLLVLLCVIVGGALLGPIVAGVQPSPVKQPVPATTQSVLPVPSVVAQNQAKSLIHDTFQDDFAKHDRADRQALAVKLLAESKTTTGDPAGLYTLLIEARDLAAGSGDVGTMLEAIDALKGVFKVDPATAEEPAVLTALHSEPTLKGFGLLADRCLSLADGCVEREDFPAAARWANEAGFAGRSSHDSTAASAVMADVTRIRSIVNQADRLRPMYTALKENPSDPQANADVGRFECFVCDNWPAGLAKLAVSGDTPLAPLAARDLRSPSDGPQTLALGDAWWDVAQSEPKIKLPAAKRAGYWYNLAVPSANGLQAAKINQRLTEIAKLTAPEGGPVRVVLWWTCSDTVDVYLDGKPLGTFVPDFAHRPDQSGKTFSAEVDLSRHSVITLGARSGGAHGFLLIACDPDTQKTVYTFPAEGWRCYLPSDLAHWFEPDVATASPSTAATKVDPAKQWIAQKTLAEAHGRNPGSVWTEGLGLRYFYFVVR